MKTACIALCAAALGFAAPALAHENAPKPAPTTAPVVQHSGGTDSRGCHTNHTTGDYHCHNPK